MSEQDLSGKHALVCGASSGIGRAAAIALAERGASVTALARREDALQSLVAELGERGLKARALVADLEQLDGLRAAISGLLAEHGPVHVLLNNTGGPPGGPLLKADCSEFEVAFKRHVVAAHALVQALLPGMQEAGYGRIVNVISTSVREPIPNLGVSNTIRGAMASWAKSLSKELPPGITINSILPGFVDTQRLASLAEGRAKREGTSPDAVREAWLRTVPEGRLGLPEELGGVIAFLASPAGAFVRGVCLPVDGGRLNSI